VARYDYRCPDCGIEFEEVHPMSEYDKDTPCPECGAVATRLISCPTVYAENICRVSQALGVHPSQIPEARKIHPGAEFTADGAMKIKDRTEKLKRLKERNWVEYD
jgi:putative FmdB family regulatory protein